MSDPTRERILASFDRELEASPVPPGLRERAIRAAVTAPPASHREPRLLALVAAVVAIALIATLVIGSHLLLQPPVPAHSPVPPAPRADASVVYDGARGQLLVFGGSSGPRALLNDTWTWDGKGWTEHHPGSKPKAGMESSVAYDEAHHVVVLFGGWGVLSEALGQQVYQNATWTWDGSTWREQHPRHRPALDFNSPATMGFDPVSRSVLLFGFATTATGSLTGATTETWSWNGSDWRQLNPPVSSQSTGDMFSDGKHLFMTSPPFNAGAHVQMSEWDGVSWTPVGSQNELQTDSGLMSAAFDIQRQQLVVLTDGDTWTWDRSRWLRQHPSQQPPTGNMVYFPPLHEVISWGERWGVSSNTVWGWNGTDWSVITAGTVPPAPTPSGQFGPTTPAAAEAFIRQMVKSSSPVLLPAWLPDGLEAQVEASADDFTVTYRSDQRDKQIYFGIVVANPPPGGRNPKDVRLKFRNALAPKYGQPGDADYHVYDTTMPTSQRWLEWREPGTMANPQTADGGVPYFLSAAGLTDQEFWQVANSLR